MKSQRKELLEFLMTYGWVVIIAVGTLGALSYFNIFDITFTTIPTGAVTSFNSDNLNKYGGLITIGLLSIILFFYFRASKKK